MTASIELSNSSGTVCRMCDHVRGCLIRYLDADGRQRHRVGLCCSYSVDVALVSASGCCLHWKPRNSLMIDGLQVIFDMTS